MFGINWRSGRELLRASLVLFATVLLTACGAGNITINPPAANSNVTSPFDVEIRWDGDINGLDVVRLDTTDVKSSFIFDYGNKVAKTMPTAKLTASAGPHTLYASYQIPPTIFGQYGGSRKEGTISFTVAKPFTIAVSPTTVSLARGGSQAVTATISPASGFTGAVTVTIAGLPTGVTSTITSTSPTTSSIALVASATAPGGTATATVTGTSPCPPTPCADSATLGVTVTPPGFRITSTSPTNIRVPRGGSSPLTVNVQRVGGFTGPINITAANLPAGVTAPVTTIAAAATSGTLTFSATTSAGLAAVAAGTAAAAQQVDISLGCTPACPTMTASSTVPVSVVRRLGLFAVAAPSVKNAPGAATGADGAVGLTYTVANPAPPGTTQFTALYKRTGSSATLFSGNLVQATDWGAGFCGANPTIAGVVLSGTYGGVTNAPLFYQLPIWAPAPATTTARSFTQAVYSVNTNANTTIVPILWYSPDCTLVAFVQSSFTQTPPAALTILDMRTGQPIATALPYAGASPSKLEVVATATGQEVHVTFSPTDLRKVPIP